MARKRNPEVTIDTAHPHTIKKFELIEAYVKAWAQKLLNNQWCNGIVFIDCMSNSGVYQDDSGNEVIGTPIRVANHLSVVMENYSGKQAWCYFNDLSADKIDMLKSRLPATSNKFHIVTRTDDGNTLLKAIKIPSNLRVHYLLVYDPYQASVDWEALTPFLCNWGDVIINHMVSDSIRAVSQVKRSSAIAKYEQTYLSSIQELASFGSDRDVFEQRVQEIMTALRGGSKKRYYIGSFPFFNTRNTVVYNLILGSSNIVAFKLFKSVAWKTFDGRSSAKNTHGNENQLMLDITGEGVVTTHTDEDCFNVSDIAKYLYSVFKGKANVPLKDVWAALDEHPVFPSEGYAREIRSSLEKDYGCKVSRQKIGGKSKDVITFPNRR